MHTVRCCASAPCVLARHLGGHTQKNRPPLRDGLFLVSVYLQSFRDQKAKFRFALIAVWLCLVVICVGVAGGMKPGSVCETSGA